MNGSSTAAAAISLGAAALWRPGHITELRALKTGRGVESGYFDTQAAFVQAVCRLDAEAAPAGIYATLNSVEPALLARAQNRVVSRVRETTQDKHVVRRERLLIDLDADRPTGISATNAEHEAALLRSGEIHAFLAARGWTAPLHIDSGNGAHLVYAVSLANDAAANTLVQNVLKALSNRFSDSDVKVDESVSNAARIAKVPGTMARKGDNLPERPHRRSKVLDLPPAFGQTVVTEAQLVALVNELTPSREAGKLPAACSSSFDLEAFLAAHVAVKRGPEPYEGGERWIIACPFDPAHSPGTAVAILRLASGALVFKCQHEGCLGRTWQDVRERFEPRYRERSASRSLANPPSVGRGEYRIAFVRADEVEPAAINWFMRDRLPMGELSILEGDGGVGKSSVALDLIARKSRGAALPDGTPCAAGIALIVADEDAKPTIVARLQAAGANLANVLILTHLGPPEAPRGFVIPEDAPELERFIREQAVELVYLDSLFNHFASGMLPKNPQDARLALTPLAKVAHNTAVPILATRHWGKTAGDAAGRGLGAGEIKNIARAVLVVARLPDTEGVYAVAIAKKNYGRDVAALTYRIESQQVFEPKTGRPMKDAQNELFTVGRIAWGDEADISADDLSMAGGQDADARASRESCAQFLEDFLAAGPVASAKVYEAAAKRKFSNSTTLRAAKNLRVVMQSGGFPKTTKWSLPSVTSQSRQQAEVDVTGGAPPQTASHVKSRQYSDVDVTGETDAREPADARARARGGVSRDVTGDVTARTATHTHTSTPPPTPPRARAREAPQQNGRTRDEADAQDEANEETLSTKKTPSPFLEIADETGRAKVDL